MEPLTLNGTGVGGNGALVSADTLSSQWDGPITLASDSSIGVVTGGVLDVEAAISGPGGLTKVGSGELGLHVATSYGGATIVSAGVLRISNATSLGSSGSGTTVVTGAALEIAAAGITVTGAADAQRQRDSAGGALRNENAATNVWWGRLSWRTALR